MNVAVKCMFLIDKKHKWEGKNMNMFQSKLSKALIKRLPHSTGYEWSRRIEGALEQTDEVTSHKYVTFIIDCEISKNDCTQIFNEVLKFVKKDSYFMKSKYRILLWKDSDFTLVQPMNVSYRILGEVFAKVDSYNTVSGNWENFKELYPNHRKAGQVILITTARKVAQLGVDYKIREKNLLVLFTLDDVVNNINPNVGVTCIGYEKINTNMGEN